MKKPLIFYLNFLFVLYIGIAIYSCSNNPIQPPPPDPVADTSSRYIWKKIEFPYTLDLFSIFGADTNNIWIQLTFDQIAYYNGNTFSPFALPYSDFSLSKLDGYDKNNLFFIGGKRKNVSELIPMLIKYTNGSFDTTLFRDNSFDNHLWDIVPTGPNSAWLGAGSNGIVYYYENGSYKKYQLHDSLYSVTPFVNPNGEIFMFGFQFKTDEIYNYKFNGSSFDLLSIQPLTKPNGLSDMIFRCGKDIIISAISRRIYYFNGNEWVLLSDLSNIEQSVYRLGGVSKDSLVAPLTPTTQIYTYNGIKWRSENFQISISPQSGFSPIVPWQVKNGVVYGTYSDQFGVESYLLIGKPKN